MSSIFAPGTIVLFQSNTAPVGWTKSTNAVYDNCSLRIVANTASSGGTTTFTDRFSNTSISMPHGLLIQGRTGETTLTANQLPAHTHTAFLADETLGSSFPAPGANPRVNKTGGPAGSRITQNRGGSVSHSHFIWGNSSIVTIGYINDMRVRYVDFIVASKDA